MRSQFGVSDAHGMLSSIHKKYGKIGATIILVHKNNSEIVVLDIQPSILKDAYSLKRLTDGLSNVEYQKIIVVAECWAHSPSGKSQVALFVEYQESGFKGYISFPKSKSLGKLEPLDSTMGWADEYFMRLVA